MRILPEFLPPWARSPDKASMIIDAHCHLGDYHPRGPLRVTTAEQIIATMDNLGIHRACLSSLKSFLYDVVSGNDEVARVCQRYPDRFIPWAVVHPRLPSASGELWRCVRERGFRGVVLDPDSHRCPADTLAFQNMVAIAEDLCIPVAVQTSQSDIGHPRRLLATALRFPRVTFIAMSLGRILAWMDAVELALAASNVLLDTTDAAPVEGLVEYLCSSVGADRIVWGTNLPLSYPLPNLTRILSATVPVEQREAMLGGNLERLLGGSARPGQQTRCQSSRG